MFHQQVFRVQASFIAHPGATSLLGRDTGSQNPWFGREASLKPRDAVVPSLGYTFVSADYSQVRYCCPYAVGTE